MTQVARRTRPSGQAMTAFLQDAGVNAFRVVRHDDGTYTAGFLFYGDLPDLAADYYADEIRRLVKGVTVIEAGVDLAPGYKTLGFAGCNTPMVRFQVRDEWG